MSQQRIAARYAVDLAKKNSEALSFIPAPRVEQYAERGQLLLAHENDDPCGFLIFGAGLPETRIYQACIQYDARRRQSGLWLVARLKEAVTPRGAECIRLWCADDLEANSFWQDAGFTFVAQREGGRRRGRKHNLWVSAV